MTDFFKTEMNCLGPAPQKDKGAVKSTEKCLLLVDISYVNVFLSPKQALLVIVYIQHSTY